MGRRRGSGLRLSFNANGGDRRASGSASAGDRIEGLAAALGWRYGVFPGLPPAVVVLQQPINLVLHPTSDLIQAQA